MVVNVPSGLDVADVVERLHAEAAVSDTVSQLRVCHRVKVSRGHYTSTTRRNTRSHDLLHRLHDCTVSSAEYLFFMAARRSRCGHYIFALWFLSFYLLSSFPRLISAAAHWMSTIL